MGYPRISARRGQPVDLNVTFYRNGLPVDPFAVRSVTIYQTSVQPANVIAVIPFVDPTDPNYPAPATTGTEPGRLILSWVVPDTVSVPDVFFDVWSYFADNPCDNFTGGASDETAGICKLDEPNLQNQLLACCHRFWAYPDTSACVDDLCGIKFAFEPLDQKFNQPEQRCLQVGLMPLPLYSFDVNKTLPLIPLLTATISIQTRNCELLVDKEQMTIGLRTGDFRSNPFVLQYQLDSTRFLIGTYRYRVTLSMPDGTSQVSPWFMLQIT